MPATPPKGTPVKPSWPVCRMADIASFTTGVWNNTPHSPKFLRALHDNFQKFSAGPNAFYQPYVSINHDDKLQAGYVSAARMGQDNIWRLDADDIPEVVGSWRNAGRLKNPSIEYFEPVRDAAGNLVDGFRGPDGKIVDGPVLKCLTLLGAEAPAVKGLPPLPFATFAQSGKVSRYGVTNMRADWLAALQAAGMDVSGITEAVPDEVLKAFVDLLQKANANPAATAQTDANGNANSAATGTPFADATAAIGTPAPAPMPAAMPALGPSGGGTMSIPQPTSITAKFADATEAKKFAEWQDQYTKNINAVFTVLQQQVAAVQNTTNNQLHAAKFADVTNFVNSLAIPDANGVVRITPAQKLGLVTLLMKCDNVRVKKFADGKTDGHELQEQKAMMLATLPKIKIGGEKIKDPQVVGGAGGTGISPERRQEMLKATPQGRAILERERLAGAGK